MPNEPLINAAIIVALVAALANLLRALGVPITDDLVDAINDVMVIAAPIAVAIIARRYVTPLSQPRDQDGATLSRPGDVPAIKELEALQEEAIELNVTRGGAR